MRPIIRVERLGKRYEIGARREALADAAGEPPRRRARGRRRSESLWALKDVSFEVRPGEVVGVLGHNGAGKSTLLKILTRITEPTEGRAELYGRVGSLLEVGTGFHPELTGRENIFLNGTMLGMKRVEIARKFDEIVAFSGVEKFLETPVKRYSSGMYTRLAFAVAAHLEPEILLVDEVLAVGDAAFQKKCLGKMKNVAQEGRTVMYVSHNLPSVVVLCNRALLFSSGRLVEDGPTAQVVESYLAAAEEAGGSSVAWDSPESAPGTHRMRLRSVRTLNGRGEVSDTFDMDESIFVELTYWLLEPGLETNVGYHLHTANGVMAFVSQDFHDAEWLDVPKEAGCYRSVCEIPGKFLNQGIYFLDAVVFMALGLNPDIFEKRVLRFEVVDRGQSEVRGRFTGEWSIGVLRPKLPWKTERLPEGGPWG